MTREAMTSRRNAIGTAAILAVLPLAGCSGPTTPVTYSAEPANRVRLNFNTDWVFHLGDFEGAEAVTFDDASWQGVCLPHTVRIEALNCSDNKNYQGVCWYRRRFTLDSAYRDREVYVQFEAAMSVAQVWVNGSPVVTHYGGYTPFAIDITSLVKWDGAENFIAARLDNSDNLEVPPGKQQHILDFCYFGGLYRDVTMILTDRLHVTDAVYANKAGDGGILVTYSSVSPRSAKIQIQTNVRNEGASAKKCAVRTTIVDASDNTVVAAFSTGARDIRAQSDFTFIQSTTLSKPKLWSPDTPHLYDVHTAVLDGGAPVDDCTTRIGIRTVAFSNADGFQINGDRMRFMGANRHQEYPYIGYAASNNLQYRDAVKFKEEGMQFIRLSHYPQDPSFLDACDALGIMILEPVPGWQFSGGRTFTERSYQDMRDMLRRDRNHPSIILWELSLNESDFAESYARQAVKIGRAELPGSLIGGWKWPNVYDVFLCSSQAGARTYTGTRPVILISEYGDWDYGENMSTSRVGRGDSESMLLTQVKNFQESLNANRSMTWESGDAVWVGIDYNRGYNPNIEKSGTMDLFRLPKFSYFLYQSQRDPNILIPGLDSGPMVFIANRWTSDSPTDVKVFSNCEKVRLSLDGVELATQSPDTGQPYLLHPPFTFPSVAFRPGTLKAEGLIGGVVKASYSAGTPGAAATIDVAFDTCGVNPVADGADSVIVHAYVRDGGGALVTTDNRTPVSFGVAGPAIIVGANPAVAEAGIASVLVRTTRAPGTITVTAAAGGLSSGSAGVESVVVTDLIVPDKK